VSASPRPSESLPELVRGEQRVVHVTLDRAITSDDAAATYRFGVGDAGGGPDYFVRTFGPTEYSATNLRWAIVLPADQVELIPVDVSTVRVGAWRLGMPEPVYLDHWSVTTVPGRPT
jgi:hypothetical protein